MCAVPTKCSNYWKKVIEEIELKAKVKTAHHHVRDVDFSVTLTENLRNRVAQIIPYEYAEFDKNAYIDVSEVELPPEKDDADEDDVNVNPYAKKKEPKGTFNESTCSEIMRMENEFPKFDLKIDMPLEQRKKETKKTKSWLSQYVCKQRRDRVKWDSRIYNLERSIYEKSLNEQAEQLMDASAERFCEWINNLGSHHENDMTKEQLKALFSIEGERHLLASIQTEPKEVKAIAKAVADKWNLPEMAIELKYEKCVESRLRSVPKKVVKVAFGRTVPEKDRPWVPSPNDSHITTIFPNDLLSGERLFKGIGHLRSVKMLIDFYRSHPRIDKPQYLLENGFFEERTEKTIRTDIPLYEKLKLKY